jgi:hypothetical protein
MTSSASQWIYPSLALNCIFFVHLVVRANLVPCSAVPCFVATPSGSSETPSARSATPSASSEAESMPPRDPHSLPIWARFARYPGPDWNKLLADEKVERKPHRTSPPTPPYPPPGPAQTVGSPTCTHLLECSLSKGMRSKVYQAFQNGYTHRIPDELGYENGIRDLADGGSELLVPIRKQIMPPAANIQLDWKPAPWPTRIDLNHLNWAALPNGERFRECGKSHALTNEVHLYCKCVLRLRRPFAPGALTTSKRAPQEPSFVCPQVFHEAGPLVE